MFGNAKKGSVPFNSEFLCVIFYILLQDYVVVLP